MPETGVELSGIKAPKTPILESDGAKSDARDAQNPPQDADLAAIVKAWRELPEHIKAAIKALVQTHKAEKK
ncbi:MAG: hypothetical protein ACYSWQ_02315 [Planctomycetota bacterium]|jgi:hypothetical protein